MVEIHNATKQPVICTLMKRMVMTKMILMTSMMMVMVTVKIGTSGVVVDHVVFLDAINSLQRGHLE